MDIQKIESYFIEGSYETFLKQLDKLSLIKEFPILFTQNTFVLETVFQNFFMDENITYVEEFFYIFRKKIKKEFKKNIDNELIAKTVIDIFDNMFRDISNLTNDGGIFIPHKSEKSIREAVKTCAMFNYFCEQNNCNTKKNHPISWFLRFNESNWVKGYKIVLSTYDEIIENEQNKKIKDNYLKQRIDVFNTLLYWKSPIEIEAMIPEIVNKFNETNIGFGKKYNIKLSDSFEIIDFKNTINNLLDNGLLLSQLGSIDFWCKTYEITEYFIGKISEKQIIDFYKNIETYEKNNETKNLESLNKIKFLCEKKILHNELITNLKINNSKINYKIKI